MYLNHWNSLFLRLQFGRVLKKPIQVKGGLLHTMWCVETSQGKFAVKELNPSILKNETIIYSYDITERISERFFSLGIPVITSFKWEGKSVIQELGAYFIVYPWFNGETFPSNINNRSCSHKIASLLAKIHSLNLSMVELQMPKWDLHKTSDLEKRFHNTFKQSHNFNSEFKKLSDWLLKINDNYHSHINSLSSQLLISHGDLDPKNVLWDQYENPVLIDWESARYLNPTQESLNAAFDWSGIISGKIDKDIYISFLKKYKEAGGILNFEHLSGSLYVIIGNWMNWLLLNLDRCSNLENDTKTKRLGNEQVIQSISVLASLKSFSDSDHFYDI